MAEAVSSVAWWEEAVFYQIYPRSFSDSSGSGVGDLRGITAHLDDLVWLGVDALWISPFFKSPMRDFGYDVSDYCEVDPLFGTLADFDRLIENAHALGLRVIIDWVPAHTSSDHAWFLDARSSRDSARRDWYVWRDPGPNGEVPNNWASAFSDGGPAWTLDQHTGQFYLHSFLSEQPDLNWANPDLRAAMHDTLRFWLDRGVDGFRADVVHNIGKDAALASVPAKLEKIPHCALNDADVTHDFLRDIRELLGSYADQRMMVGEVFLLDVERMATYHGRGDELHLAFNFPAIFLPWDAAAWRNCIDTTYGVLERHRAWPTWVVSNHDFSRQRTRFGGGEDRARAAAVLLLGLRGTPFMYMGEELGLEDADVPEEARVDPGGRDGCRAPIPWEVESPHGWQKEPWLPFSPKPAERSWQAQRSDPDSVLHFYRRLLVHRRQSPALWSGSFEWLPTDEHLLAWRRGTDSDERVVIISFADEQRTIDLDGDYQVAVSTKLPDEGQVFRGEISPTNAIVLQPV